MFVANTRPTPKGTTSTETSISSSNTSTVASTTNGTSRVVLSDSANFSSTLNYGVYYDTGKFRIYKMCGDFFLQKPGWFHLGLYFYYRKALHLADCRAGRTSQVILRVTVDIT